MATENKNLSSYDKSTIPNAKNYRFGIVVSNWNQDVTEGLYQGVINTLYDCGAQKQNIKRIDTPGSFELIHAAKKLHQSKINFDAIIVIGCVIKGETMHFEFVCQGVTYGISKLNILYDTPTIFCVLTDQNKEQSLARSGGTHGNKGVEAAVTALKMISLSYD